MSKLDQLMKEMQSEVGLDEARRKRLFAKPTRAGFDPRQKSALSDAIRDAIAKALGRMDRTLRKASGTELSVLDHKIDGLMDYIEQIIF
jgi:hypothetical protein